MRELVERGFTAPRGLLVVRDGAKGLRAAVRDVFGADVAEHAVSGTNGKTS